MRVHSNVRAGSPRQCCRWYSQAHAPTDEGTEKQGKLCCRCRTAVLVVAHATRSFVGHMSGRRIFRLHVISSWGTKKRTTKSSTCTKGSRVGPTSRAYSEPEPGLVCPTAAAAVAAAATPAATGVFFSSQKNEPKHHGCIRLRT